MISSLPIDEAEANPAAPKLSDTLSATNITARPAIIDPNYRIEYEEKPGPGLDPYSVFDAFLTAMGFYAVEPFLLPIGSSTQEFFNQGSKIVRVSLKSETGRTMAADEAMYGIMLCAQKVARATTPFKPAGCTLRHRASPVEDRRVGYFVVSLARATEDGSSIVGLGISVETANISLVARSGEAQAEVTDEANGRWKVVLFQNTRELLQIPFALSVLEVLVNYAAAAPSESMKEAYPAGEKVWSTAEGIRVWMKANVPAGAYTLYAGGVYGLMELVRAVKKSGRFLETDFEIYDTRGFGKTKTVTGRIYR